MWQGKKNGAGVDLAQWAKRWLRHPLEAGVLWLVFTILGALPTDTASNVGGWLGRLIGPRLRGERRARVNLALAMPTLTPEQVDAVLAGMWDNLGRVLAEYPHLQRIADPASGRVTVRGMEHVQAFMEDGGPGILIGGHLANWEVLPLVANLRGLPLSAVARPVNNPMVNRLIERCRGAHGPPRLDKNDESARQMLAVLREGRVVGLLADQKFNRGIDLPFFGQPAPTTDGPAQLGLRTGAPVVPVQVIRDGPGRFTLVCHPPLPSGSADESRREQAIKMMEAYHRHLEDWIGERPAEWLWIHRRWPKELYQPERLGPQATG